MHLITIMSWSILDITSGFLFMLVFRSNPAFQVQSRRKQLLQTGMHQMKLKYHYLEVPVRMTNLFRKLQIIAYIESLAQRYDHHRGRVFTTITNSYGETCRFPNKIGWFKIMPRDNNGRQIVKFKSFAVWGWSTTIFRPQVAAAPVAAIAANDSGAL